jgi:hypothetical protein
LFDPANVLASNGANVNAQTSYFKEIPLRVGIQEREHKMIDFLIASKSNVNMRNYQGENSVFLAVRWYSVDVLNKLLDSGANPHLYNKTVAPVRRLHRY